MASSPCAHIYRLGPCSGTDKRLLDGNRFFRPLALKICDLIGDTAIYLRADKRKVSRKGHFSHIVSLLCNWGCFSAQILAVSVSSLQLTPVPLQRV